MPVGRAIDEVFPVDETGHLSARDRKWLAQIVGRYRGRKVRIRVSLPVRSGQANAWYWVAVIRPIRVAFIDAGYESSITEHAVHVMFRDRYLPVGTADGPLGPVTLPPSTAQLTSSEFFDYIDRIRADESVIQLGVRIEEPNTKGWRGYGIADAG